VSPAPSDDAVHAAQAQRQVLGRAARLLASAADFDDTLRQTIGACLPALGDFGFFDVVVADGEVRRTCAAHQAPDIEALLAPTRWARQPPGELNLCALSSGAPALHAGIDDTWFRRVAANEGHLELLRALAFRSMITVPVRYRDETVGSLTLFMGRSGREHSALDLEFAAELAALAAPVVVNARLVLQHQRAEAALRESEERLRTAVEAGQVGVWDWDIVANSVTWSDRVFEMHGMPVGSDTGGLEGFRSRIHPDDVNRVEAALRSALEGGPPYAVEFRTRLGDGRTRWIATRSRLVRDAQGRPLRMIGASIDTTERQELLAAERRARNEAEAARGRLELLAGASALLSQSLDVEATLQAIATVVAPRVADWCRIDLLDESGVLRRRIAHHANAERARQALEMARTLRAAPTTVGSMAWCIQHSQPYHGRFDESPAADDPALRLYTQTFGMREHYILPLIARGRTLGAMGVVQAESGRTLGEEDRALLRELGLRAALAIDNARLYAEAEAARQEAERASRAKDEFLAMLGHELRNPLAPITTALELMARRDSEAHVQERKIIARQVAHLSRLIDDLLDVSRITQGKVELQRQPVDMKAIVAQALEQTQPLYAKRARPVQVAVCDAGTPVSGDGVRLTQVLCNLLINAAKFTPPERDVRLALRAEPGWIEAVVEDEGRGIAPGLLPRVFDLFVQGGQGIDRQGGGLGLGLAIVRRLVELHGGTVTAHSEGEGRGSRFTVRLPASGAPAPLTLAEPSGAPAHAASARLLIVDDNQDAAFTLAELLRMDGYEVRCAPDGPSALELLQSAPADLALLDIGLPGIDGYELASRIRGSALGTAIKLVALTGYGQDNDRARAKAARFDEHLVKPVAPDRLVQVLQDLLPGR
jgi:PAS domain S-box-containing protein